LCVEYLTHIMTTRFNAVDQMKYNVSGIKSGYDSSIKSDFSIPPCGLEDVDVSIFTLFDKEIAITIGGKDSQEIKKVPIVFAAGEKWAMLKKGRPLRDKNNTLILPLVTIARSSIAQEKDDVTGRGINQQTGEIVIRRRLDKSDRSYQNLINKYLILNQSNVAITSGSQYSASQSFITGRTVGSLEKDLATRSGALLLSNRKNNVFETLVVPSPQFYSVKYQITIWAQYTQHMNQIIEKIMSSFLPQAQSWKLTTTKGYWFVASFEGGAFNIENNFDDMSAAERYMKCSFEVKVPAYIWASDAPGVPIPVKRYVSSPIIDFAVTSRSTNTSAAGPEEFLNNYSVGSDDPTLPLDEQANLRNDQRRPGLRKQFITPSNSENLSSVTSEDPASTSYPRGTSPSLYQKISIGNDNFKYVKVVTINAATGETVYSAADFQGLKIIPT